MPSAIDVTRPPDGVPASKAEIRANWAAAQAELEHGGFFTQPAAGAIERTAQDRLREMVTITDFGAVGDDATDNATALTNAIAAALAGSRRLYVPRGTFRTSATLDFSGVHVFGVRQGSALKLADSIGTNVNLITTSGGTILEYLTLDGNKSNQDRAACAAGDYGHLVVGGDEVRIDYCKLRDSPNAGIKGTSNEIHVNHCDISDCTRWSIDFNSAADSSISDCSISFGGHTAEVDDGSIHGNVRIGSAQVLLDHNHIWQAVGQNVLAQNQRSCLITNNRMDGCTRENILVTGSCFVQIYNNLLYDAGVNRSGKDTHTNAFRRSQIRIDGDSSNCHVANNSCRTGPKSFGAESYLDESDYGIHVSGSGHTIESNHVLQSKIDGIYVSSRYSRAANNTVWAAADNGINVDGVGHEIDGNKIALCGTGINVSGSDCIVDRNNIIEQVNVQSTALSANEGATASLNVASSSGFAAGDLVAVECDRGIHQVRRVKTASGNVIALNRSLHGSGTVASSGNTVTTRRVTTGINLTAGSNNNVGTGNRILRQSGTALVDAGTGNSVGAL